MKISLDAIERGLVACLDGRLDGISSPEFRDKLLAWIDAGHKNVIIDCALLSYVSSAGLRVFYQALDKLEEKEGAILFCRVSEDVKRVFDMVDMGADFPIFPTREEALKQLR
jgi:anti-anti-sigma factor